ncbi:hypothetical protein GCM10027589_19620 [Actinocorallia lasiicapitis]
MKPPVIASIVEGHGEVAAVPVLLRRVAASIDPTVYVDAPKPLRVPRDSIIKPGGLERSLTTVLRMVPRATGLLVLLDADDDCAVTVADDLRRRGGVVRPDLALSVVLPVREFEAWFLAGASGLSGKSGLPADLKGPDQPENVRGAKEWFTKQMPPGQIYQAPAHQPRFAQHFDLDAARAASPSFDKFHRDLTRLIAG